jgi:hypothetical protein
MAAARRRRWPWLLGALALLLASGAIFVNAQLEPHRLAATVLGKAGEALQLRLSFRGTPEYAFRPEPRLVLPGFSAAARDGDVFLSARRAEISLPWSTLTGDEPVITRIELDAPVISLPGLQRWLASRPPTPFKLPTISHGIAVRDGTLRSDSWSLRALSLDLPHLQSGDAAQVHAKGEFAAGKTVLPFDLDANAATPGLASPLDLKLQLQLAADKTADGKRPAPNPIALSMLGRYSWMDPLFTLEVEKLAVVARSPLPSFEGKGKLESANLLYLDFDAVLSRWPEAWPKLPASVAAGGDKLPVHVGYEGKRDFSDWLQLSAARDGNEIQASLRVAELQRWLAADAASPLPPLQGRLKAPSLVLDGVELEGVEVELSDGGSTKAAP